MSEIREKFCPYVRDLISKAVRILKLRYSCTDLGLRLDRPYKREMPFDQQMANHIKHFFITAQVSFPRLLSG